jgi:hypothetical protein
MKRSELEHVIRAAGSIGNDREVIATTSAASRRFSLAPL